MKILSYNVNGIRSAMEKGLVSFLAANDFAVVGFQELKAQPQQFAVEAFEALGYHCYWLPAEKKGYSGVGILSKVRPTMVEMGCGVANFDSEGRVIRADIGDYTFVSAYFPSGTTGDERQRVKMAFLETMQDWAQSLREKRPNLIIMGDFNIAHQPIDVYNPDKAKKMSGFLPEEREWLSNWLKKGFVDAFRQQHPVEMSYSWWSFRRNNRAENKGWRIDYQCISENLCEKIVDCQQLQDIVHSDHCPVLLDLNIHF